MGWVLVVGDAAGQMRFSVGEVKLAHAFSFLILICLRRVLPVRKKRRGTKRECTSSNDGVSRQSLQFSIVGYIVTPQDFWTTTFAQSLGRGGHATVTSEQLVHGFHKAPPL